MNFAPLFSERVKSVRAEHIFAQGMLRVEICRGGNTAHCKIFVPRGISVRVTPPEGWISNVPELVCGENEVVFTIRV